MRDSGDQLVTRNAVEWTPIHFALKYKHRDVVEYLARNNALIIGDFDDFASIFHLATATNDQVIVQTLLEHGFGFDNTNHNGWNFLHFAISNGHENIVEMVLSTLSEPILRRGDIYQRTAMHHAAINGQLHIIQILDSLGFDLYHDRDKFGKTPLHYAAELGHLRTLKFLLTKIGINEKDRAGQTPLHLAVANNNYDVVCTLLNDKEHIEINVTDYQNRTPLYLGVENGHKKIVKLLISNNADITILPSDKRSLITMAVITRNNGMLKYLCSLPNIDVFYPDVNKWTPAHYAAQLGEELMMQDFFKIDPSSLSAVDFKDRNPLHLASIWNQYKIIEFYNDSNDTLFNEKDSDGNTPLHLAVKRGNVQIARYLVSSTNSDLNIQNNEGILNFFFLSNSSSYSY